MKSPRKPPPWSRRHTAALLHVLKIPVPPDFQAQVMRQVRELHHAALTRQTDGVVPLRRWQVYANWLRMTLQRRPMALTATVASVGLLLCSASLAWWFSSPRGDDLRRSAVVSLAGMPQPGDPALDGHDRRDVRAGVIEAEQPPLTLPVPSDLGASTLTAPLANEPETPKTPSAANPQKPATVPSPVPHALQSSGVSPLAPKAPIQRSGLKRNAPEKNKGSKKGPRVAKHPAV